MTDSTDSDPSHEDFDEQMNAEDLDATTFDTEAEVSCPYCGEIVTVDLDPGSGPVQTYVEDCQVCCRPWHVYVRYDEQGMAQVWVETE